ncbi:MAG: hypothetical protein ACOYO1_00545 [Bacteroidales bacterium]
MKKNFYLMLIAFSFFAIVSGCKKDSSGNPIIPGINTSMTAKIDGLEWASIVRTCTKNGNTIDLNGVSADGKIIQLYISPNITTENLVINKDYTLPVTSFYKKQATTTINDIYFATVGTVRLTSLDLTNKLVSGSFSFSAISTSFGTASITTGVFANISFVGN